MTFAVGGRVGDHGDSVPMGPYAGQHRSTWERRCEREQVMMPNGSMQCQYTWFCKNPETERWELV